jgi:hypothetical protein
MVLLNRQRMTACLALYWLCSCVPDENDNEALITAPRVLAIRAEPAEAAPREKVTLSALYVGPDGVAESAPIDWAFCLRRKSLAELGPVARECLVQESGELQTLGQGDRASATLPQDACRLFGPDRPPPMNDEPIGRPVDPDPFGGFYQPVRVYDTDTSHYTLFEQRISCALPGVTQTEFANWNRRYRRNQNPRVAALTDLGSDQTLASDDEKQPPFGVAKGQKLRLRASWADCSDGTECGDGICGADETRTTCVADCAAPLGCEGAEHYLYYDRGNRSFVMRREGVRVAWFATGGQFDEPRTGRSEAEADASHSDNIWTAPKQPGELSLWLVLRDDRGGSAWQSYRLTVE